MLSLLVSFVHYAMAGLSQNDLMHKMQESGIGNTTNKSSFQFERLANNRTGSKTQENETETGIFESNQTIKDIISNLTCIMDINSRSSINSVENREKSFISFLIERPGIKIYDIMGSFDSFKELMLVIKDYEPFIFKSPMESIRFITSISDLIGKAEPFLALLRNISSSDSDPMCVMKEKNSNTSQKENIAETSIANLNAMLLEYKDTIIRLDAMFMPYQSSFLSYIYKMFNK